MGKSVYYCEYKNSRGDILCEEVMAYSDADARRMIMLKHPLAEDVSVSNSSAKKAHANKQPVALATNRIFIALLAMLSLIIVCLVVVVTVVLTRERDDVKKVPNVESSAVSQEEEYSRDYRNIVSISTPRSKSTGFKLRTPKGVYLYTCFHCIQDSDAIQCTDSDGKRLELGDLELCCSRDLVRFHLPDEKEGFELANKKDLSLNALVIAYGDTAGRGVMTLNKGKILAIGNHKIEIDAAVLSGNSGGPVLTEEGKVVGVVSSGSFDDSIWAKDTRYEKVRKFAERIDNGEWVEESYDEIRELYAFLYDTYVMTSEFREYAKTVAGRSFSQEIVRPFVYDQRYLGDDGYAGIMKDIYQAWNDMTEVERERRRKWDDTNGRVGSRIHENQYYEIVKRRNSFQRMATYTLPMKMLKYALEELKAINVGYFCASREALIKDIETILIPAVEDDGKFCDRLDKDARENYNRDYGKAK